MKWQSASIGDCAELISGAAFKSAHFTDHPDDIPLVKGENVQQSFVDWSIAKRWPRSDAAAYERFLLAPDDIVVAMDRPWVPAGLKWASISDADPQALLVQRIARLRAKPSVCPKFLRYVIASPDFSDYVRNVMGGTNVPHISGDQIRKFTFPLPPVSDQRKIGSTLAAYDDLIQNNRRRIALLEQSARLLYREWFVHLRFPGHEHVKVVDGVPDGWEQKTIGEIAETIGGGTPSTAVPEYWDDGDITWFSPTDLTRNDCLALLGSAKKITDVGLKNSSAKMLPPETILMSSRASIGYFGLYDEPACTNQGFISLIPRNDGYRYYLLYNLLARREEIESKARGTTFKEINKSTFRAMQVIWPDHRLATEFSEFAGTVMKQVRTLKQQSEKIREARDLLLPRLMRGEIEV